MSTLALQSVEPYRSAPLPPISELILPLTAPSLSLESAGGKGMNLGVMVRAGLPVPAGFVMTTATYRHFVEANGLTETITNQWQTLSPADADTFEAASAVIRAAFDAAPFLPELATPLLHAYADLAAGQPVAVRSSATAEDLPEASFAGQQDTYLNIIGEDALLAAVKRCWGSLWTARAMAYRHRQGILPDQVSLAVVVQIMVPATAAGVMFTVDPVSGQRDELVINATWGLGEALVAGRVNPDTIIADKRSGQIKRLEIGEKAVMTAPDAQGTSEVAVEPAQRENPALSPAQVSELARLGRTLEALFQQPQDVEWAVAAGQVLLLQARPVTTLAAPSGPPGDDAWPTLDGFPEQAFDFWTQQDLGERWPDPITPLTWSISEAMTQTSMDQSAAGLKAPYAHQIRWCKRAFGHVYLNEGALLHAYTDGFGMPLAMMAGGLTHEGARPAGESGWQLGKVMRHLPWYWQVATEWPRNAARFEADFPLIDRWVTEFMQRDLNELSDRGLLTEARELWYGRVLKYIRYHSNVTSLSISSLTQMEAQANQVLGDAALAHTLTSGLSGVITAEMAPELWQMAQTLRTLGLERVLTTQSPVSALAELRADPHAQPFLDQFERFLQRHGHRCMVEAEFLYPRWSEAPAQVIEALTPYLNMEQAPAAVNHEAEQRREAVAAQMEEKLTWWQRRAFRANLARLHRFTRLRDNGQHYLVRLFLPIRHLYAVLGERWAARGWLPAPDAIFFLVAAELTAVVEQGDPTKAGLNLAELAADRRTAYDYWFTQPTPDALDKHGAPVISAHVAGNTLTGMAASPGQISGRARVVLSPAEANRLQPGDILVTRATDPGWTPVFSIIGGAVLEIGGTLSHGAIVAREYGLPAVVNVSGATQRIQDGQQIRLDGTRGEVILLADE